MPRHSSRVWLIAGIGTLAAIALAAGVTVGYQLGGRRSTALTVPPLSAEAPPTPAPAGLVADFARLEATLHGVAGIAVTAVGSRQGPMTLGDWRSGPAWSTIKLPLAIAALRNANPPTVTAAMAASITESDNAAAESVWESLGDPVTAAHKVDAVLRQAGDPTTVQSQRVRPEFSASGQTDWSLTDQARFTATAFCDNTNAPVFALLGQVTADQRWGIGSIAGAKFKGGWGPLPTGHYLVRQIGVLNTSGGLMAVALAVQPDSGRFEDGIADLNAMATWLSAHLGALPAGRCGQ
jgi:hypothetical protein